MKKLLIISAIAALAVTGCKKKEATVSSLYTYSTPTIVISGAQYYSIPVGGALPTISASAYDSFYHENYPVIMDQSGLDNTIPGLYVVTAVSKNKYGMAGTKSVFVAVTDVTDAMDISGFYLRSNVATQPAVVTKLARGLYMTSNVGGNDTVAQASSVLPAVFAVINDTTLDFGTQVTTAGTLKVNTTHLDATSGSESFSYALDLSGYGTQVRTFIKQ